MEIRAIHPFALSIEEMMNVQQMLGSKVKFSEINLSKVEIIAGVDLTYFENKAICVIVSIDFKSKEVVDITHSISEVRFD